MTYLFSNVIEIPELRNYPIYGENPVAILKVRMDYRDVEHDGYCSDPDEDIGEWVLNQDVYYRLNVLEKDVIGKYVNKYGEVDEWILREMVDSDYMGLNCCSGYCGYQGCRNSKYGRVITPEYLMNILTDEEYKKGMAYKKADEDEFRESEEYYWKKMEEEIEQDREVLDKYVIKEMEARERLRILKEELKRREIDDSYCPIFIQKWSRREIDIGIDEVIKEMRKWKWVHEHGLIERMNKRMKENKEKGIIEARYEVKKEIKREILREFPME